MKKIIIFGLVLWTLASPVALLGSMMVMEAAAEDAVCRSGPIIAFDRRRWCGYFFNNRDTNGDFVRAAGIPASTNTVNEFINLIKSDLAASPATAAGRHRITAAQFLILTMIDRAPGLPKSVSAAQLADWESRVRSYGSTSENGNSSSGPNGRIDWFVSQHMDCNSPENINTFYQDDEDDVAPYLNSAGNSDCEIPSVMELFIVFRNRSGTPVYTIRRECMNPMGNILGLDDAPPNYNLNPNVSAAVNGNPAVASAEVGDTVRFTYRVTNSGTESSPSVPCTIYANVHAGYFPTPPTPTSGNSPPGYVSPPTGCPRVFPVGNTQIAVENITITTPNQTICRSLFVNPASPTVGNRGHELCVPVVNKPYTRSYGGDLIAGSGLTGGTGCTPNNNAAVVGWNKRGPTYAGAASQYAIYALNAIRDFSTTLGNAAGSAPAPNGLSFANTVNNVPASGNFGGSFGSVPCIKDYYATKPSSTELLPPNVSAMTSNAYANSGSGPVTLIGGQVTADERISVFINGDLYISSSITYAGNWDRDSIPSFRLIVRGNIYVDRAVTQLDGFYVAQANGATGGNFYTCATGTAPLALNGSLFSTCQTKLTVNGAVVARSVHLLRTIGTLSQSSAAETGASGRAAEVFNYSPALWVNQPIQADEPTADYDSIISLPPIL